MGIFSKDSYESQELLLLNFIYSFIYTTIHEVLWSFQPRKSQGTVSVNVVYWVLEIVNILFNIWFILNYVHWKKCLKIRKEGAYATPLDNLCIHTQNETLAESS